MHSVLVVDDEPFVRLSIASMALWEDEGFDFRFEASNGEEALALLARRPEIDIILLDLSMPIMDGIEMLRRLRAADARPGEPASLGPAVVVLSAHDDFHLVREAFQLGAGDYLLKPELEAEKLRAALEKAAAGLAESRDRTKAILERRQIESLKAQVLRDMLVEPPSEGVAEAFEGLGISITPPFAVIGVWIEDFETVALRWRDEGLARFSDMLARSLSQLVAGAGRGEVVPLKPSQVAVILSPAPAAASFCEDASEYLGRYLSVRASCAAGPPCERFRDAAEAFRSLRSPLSVESRIVVQTKRAIRERFAESGFSLDEASSLVGVSRNHLSFEFSREAGETFTSYLSRVRIEEAKRLLSTTDLLVYEVGERVGYPSVEHFSRTFKRMVGMSPARYKSFGGDEPRGD